MKIAIHHNEGSFSDYWIEYCKNNSVVYGIVNCYDTNIVEYLEDYDILLWHHQHTDYRDLLFAKALLFSLEQAGIKVFPDFNTAWHFDDKVGQKYLLESIGAPLVPSYVFYTKEEALNWSKSTTYPKVFKLRGGAGGSNVKLINSQKEAARLINKSFGSGFPAYDKFGGLKDRINKFSSGKGSFKSVLGGISKYFVPNEFAKLAPTAKGYFYTQDFIANNDSDIRVIVIGNKAFAITRMVRDNDFRASGSGTILFDKNDVNEETLQVAFTVSKKLKAQCCAFDFVYDQNNRPLIVEISYGFSPKPYFDCEGYWTSDLKWNEKKINPQHWMVEDLFNSKIK